MNEETNGAPAHDINGGAPTDEEARLAAQLATIGDNPDVDPDTVAAPEPPAAEAATTTAATTEGAAVAPDEPAATATAVDEAVAALPATPAAPATPAVPATPPVAAGVPALGDKPAPPKDFDADYTALQERYEAGELDSGEFQRASRELARQEAAYQTKVTLWEEAQRTSQEQATMQFNAAALAWEQANKDFLSNPLRREQMNRAIAVIDQETGGILAPAELIERAGKVALEAFGMQPQQVGSVPAANADEAIARATDARKVPPVPTTLGTAPAAAAMERGGGNAAFAELDGKDINTLEDAVARMSPAQREAYLRDAPGANATGLPE